VYKLAFHPDVEGDLKRLDKPTCRRILNKIRWLVEHAEDVRHEPLTGRWAGMYKLRVGDYRAVYNINREGEVLIVYAVGHRREVYKDR